MSALATQAALVAGLAFTALTTSLDFGSGDEDNDDIVRDYNNERKNISYVFYIFFTITLVSSLFVLSQSTVVVMFGPTMAIKGNSDEAVKVASSHMRNQQMLILRACGICLTSLFLAGIIMSWAMYNIITAIINTFIYIFSFYLLANEGLKAFRLFSSRDGEVEPLLELASKAAGYKSNTTNESKINAEIEEETNKLARAQELTRTKYRNIIWKRQNIEDGGLYQKFYGIIEKGKLDLYKSEKDYIENKNPVNDKPIKLWQYDLELDSRKYSKNVVSFSSTMKSKMLGNDEFSMADLLDSKNGEESYDLIYASRHFKFGLVPKVASELVSMSTHEFLAHDEKLYKAWIKSLKQVVEAYDEIAASPSVEQTIRSGNTNIEMAVQAANNQV